MLIFFVYLNPCKGLILVWAFIYLNILCMVTAKALAILCRCSDLSESLLLGNAISILHPPQYFVYDYSKGSGQIVRSAVGQLRANTADRGL